MKISFTSLLLVVLLCLPIPARTQEGAELRLMASREEAVWIGEKVDIHLELWTASLSFSGQSYTLPEVPGAFLMQTDSSSVNMTERRGGETWQGLRYTFSLYPQRAGEIVVPSFEVRFETRAGYGSEARPHRFDTGPLSVEAVLPPGAAPGALLVTTPKFTLDASWNPMPQEEGGVELMTGDALVLTVVREADGVPGMMFAPLPEFEFDGLGVYADAAEVDDRVFRGALTGTRSDRITFVCERPGRYELPGLTFQWWNAQNEQLHEERVSPLVVDVVQNPAWAAPAAEPAVGDRSASSWKILWLLPAVLLLWWPVWPLTKAALAGLRSALVARRLLPLNPGSSTEKPG